MKAQQIRKIAIIGGGGAGVTAAWRLSTQYDITLYEAGSYLGGHAYTAHYTTSNKDVIVDMGVELFTEKLYPNFFEILKLLNIGSYVTPLSFSSNFDKKEDYWDNVYHDSAFWQHIKAECNRFHLGMHEISNTAPETTHKLTIGEYLTANQYSRDFIYKVLLPIFTTFVGSRASLLEFSLTYCAISFNVGMLSFFQAPYWRKIEGGISTYLKKISESFKDKIRLSTPITTVKHLENGIMVRDHTGREEKYDAVVFATHADIALKLLTDPSNETRRLLSNFEYSYIECVLHSDKNVLSSKPRMYCEYNCINRDPYQMLPGSMTRHMNILPEYSHISEPVLLTIDPNNDISEAHIIVRKKWKLPKLRPKDMEIKHQIRNIQGINNTWFCGMDISLTGHESAIVSGLIVSEALGVPYPFTNKVAAKNQYNVIKKVMGI